MGIKERIRNQKDMGVSGAISCGLSCEENSVKEDECTQLLGSVNCTTPGNPYWDLINPPHHHSAKALQIIKAPTLLHYAA